LQPIREGGHRADFARAPCPRRRFSDFPECRSVLARRRGARSLRRSSGRRGRDGALKTDWTKPWHGGASYGDRMAPVMVSRHSRASRRARLCGANSHNGMRAGLALCRCRDTAGAQSVADRFGSKVLPLPADENAPHIVIVGAGFGGMACAAGLRHERARVTLIDRHNYHLFQPLLYQVATAALSPADSATPIRGVFRDNPRLRVLCGTVTAVDVVARRVIVDGRAVAYLVRVDHRSRCDH